MLREILYDLDVIDEYSVDYLINSKLSKDNLSKCRPITVNDNLNEWLRCNIKSYDYIIFIAPEDEHLQYEITKIIEDENIKKIASDSTTSDICSSKIKTYNNICDVLKIPTLKVEVDNICSDAISEFIDENKTCIIKPDDRTSSDFIYKIHSLTEFRKIIKLYKDEDIKVALLQKYIKGESISISAICSRDDSKIISINSQQITEQDDNKIAYNGCITPLNHPLKDEIIKTSKRIIKQIPGLYGFIGIDYIIDDNKIYMVEINSRFTTPFIVLSENCSENLMKIIIDYCIDDKWSSIKFKDNGEFYKGDIL